MSFTRRVEDFDCEQCGHHNVGNGYTNHCARCLWSKHVDVDPGDRAAECRGAMRPIDLRVERGQFRVLHRCERCGTDRVCDVGPNDDLDALLRQ